MVEYHIIERMHMSQAGFRSALIERDRTCVVIGLSARDCDISHCLRLSKGNEVNAFLPPDLSASKEYPSSTLTHSPDSEGIQ